MVKTILCLAICILSTVCFSKTEKSAETFLSDLYAKYQKDFTQIDIKSEYADSILAPGLLWLVRLDEQRQEGDNGYLGWDPLCDCQDPDGITLDDVVTSQKNNKIAAVVKLRYLDTTKTIFFNLIDFKSKWLISDVGSPENPSLYNYLLRNLEKDFPDSIILFRQKYIGKDK